MFSLDGSENKIFNLLNNGVLIGSECKMKSFNVLNNKVLIGSKRRLECF